MARPGEAKRRISACIPCQKVESRQVLKSVLLPNNVMHLPDLLREATRNKRHLN